MQTISSNSEIDEEQIIKWLLKGDVSIQYQVYRDLLETDRTDLQDRIFEEGWGRRFLSESRKQGVKPCCL
ncbi:MAG: hypothetical protein ACOCYF_02550 [Bacteroidota bacterium]